VDQVIVILLRTGMFVSGLLGFVLDNTIPGKLGGRNFSRGRHIPGNVKSRIVM